MYRTAWFCIVSMGLMACNRLQEPTLPLPYYNDAELTPLFYADKSDALRNISHHIDAFQLQSHEGQLIKSSKLKGKIQVANFMFTRCGSICPEITRNLKWVIDRLGQDTSVVFLSFSVMPDVDSAQVLCAYRHDYGITQNNWIFLTGRQSEIYRLARTSYFAEEEIGYTRDSTEFLHTEHVVLTDGNGHIRGMYNGTLRYDMEQLLADLLVLKSEQ